MLQALRAAQCTNLYTVRVYLFPLSFEVAAAAAEERGEGGGRRHMTNMVTYAPPPPPRSRETSEDSLLYLSPKTAAASVDAVAAKEITLKHTTF